MLPVSLWLLISAALLVLQIAKMLKCRLFSSDIPTADVVPVAVVLLLCAMCLCAGLINAVGMCVPNNFILAGLLSALFLLNLCVFGKRAVPFSMRGIVALGRGNHQHVMHSLSTVVPYMLLFLLVVVCALVQFGPSLSINFASTDPATHFNLSMEVYESGRLASSRWFTYYLSARGIELLEPLFVNAEYKSFIIMEIAYLYLSGCVFFSIGKQICGQKSEIAIVLVIALLYLLGYPLNVLTFGFSYLGVGVTLVLSMVSVLGAPKGSLPLRIGLVLMLLSGLAVCYSLFVPVSLLGILVSILFKNRQFFSQHRVILICGLSAIAGAIAFVISVLVHSGLITALSSPGYSYANLYGDFLQPAPIALLGFSVFIKEEKGIGLAIASISIAAMVSIMVSLVLYRGEVFSAYYYYKFYYVLWACFSLCIARGACEVLRLYSALLLAYGAVFALVFVFAVSGFDERMSISHPELNPATVSNEIAGIYSCNAKEMVSERISSSEIDLWEAANQLRGTQEEYIPLIGSNIDVYWYQAVTRQYYPGDTRYYYYWLFNQPDGDSQLIARLSEAQYCVVLYSQTLPESLASFLQDREVVFGNEAGYICKID